MANAGARMPAAVKDGMALSAPRAHATLQSQERDPRQKKAALETLSLWVAIHPRTSPGRAARPAAGDRGSARLFGARTCC